MPDPALTQDFTANKLAFLQTHMLYISGGAPSDEDMARRIAISGYTPRRELPAVQLRPGEPTPNVTNHPADVWAGELSQEHFVRRTPKKLGFGIDADSKFFPNAVGVVNKTYKVSFAAPPANPSATAPNAYYLPYQPKKTFTMALGAECDFFFTDAINGCSFQVGGARTAPVVTHANVQGVFNDVMKREFLHQMLELARRAAEVRGGGALPTSRLQRFEPTNNALAAPNLNIAEYGTLANTAGVPTAIGGYRPGKTTIQSQGVTYEVITKFTDPSGAVLDPSGGEVAVIGFRDGGGAWTFYWQMYLPVKITVDYYRVFPAARGGRSIDYAHTITTRTNHPIVQVRQLWP
jgi:hypothetical protein